ncbi:MAG: sugar phosphate isomerase/epimerase [Faecalibacterium sp.]
MKIGFLTNSIVESGMDDLLQIAAWGKENGFQDLEIGPSLTLKEEDVFSVKNTGEIDISAFIFCRNFLSGDKEQAQEYKDNILKRIELAGKYQIPKVICSTGVSPISHDGFRYDPYKSLDESVSFLQVMLEKAVQQNVTLCVENCPLMGNIGFAPFMWKELFAQLDSPNFKLAFDPSHLIWQMIDPYLAIETFGDKIAHVHAKDTEIRRDVLAQTGILYSPKDKETTNAGWWRYRVPGLGEIDWVKIVDKLVEAEFDGTISIEHEDPIWTGTQEKVKHGLVKGRRHIENCLP